MFWFSSSGPDRPNLVAMEADELASDRTSDMDESLLSESLVRGKRSAPGILVIGIGAFLCS
jgi:hypothetical protein